MIGPRWLAGERLFPILRQFIQRNIGDAFAVMDDHRMARLFSDHRLVIVVAASRPQSTRLGNKGASYEYKAAVRKNTDQGGRE